MMADFHIRSAYAPTAVRQELIRTKRCVDGRPLLSKQSLPDWEVACRCLPVPVQSRYLLQIPGKKPRSTVAKAVKLTVPRGVPASFFQDQKFP